MFRSGFSISRALWAIVGAITLTFAVPVRAGTNYDVQLDPSMFGHINQNDVTLPNPNPPPAMLGGENSCVPTSVANSFVFLQKKYPWIYDNKLVPPGQEVASAQAIAAAMGTSAKTGTNIPGWANGKQNYLEGKVPGKTIYAGQTSFGGADTAGSPAWLTTNTNPSALFLYQQLKDNEDVEIGISPAQGIGHALTLTSIHWNDANGDGIIQQGENATLDAIDPANPNAGTNGTIDLPIWQTGNANSIINTTYGGAAYTLTVVTAESPDPRFVPVPAALWGGLMLLGGLAARKVRRKAA